VAHTSSSSATPTPDGDGRCPTRRNASVSTMPAFTTLSTCHSRKREVDTRNCASAGFRRMKSMVPVRMCSTTAWSPGLIAPSSTACIKMNSPVTTSASPKLHPGMPLASLLP